MFHISTKGDYGLLLLSSLAAHHAQGRSKISLREVSDEKKLPLKYLGEIAQELKRAGIISSKEGRDGGYWLAKAPHEISLIEVLEALEGPVEPVKCCSKEKTCTIQSSCGVKATWQEATTMMREFLKNKTLADTMHGARSA